MTEQETRKFLMMINATFPTFRVDNPEETVKAWHWALEEYPADAIMLSLQMYIKSNSSGFAPSVSQIIDGVYKPQDREAMDEGQAWSLVKKAIQDGNYHAVERFNELPELVQKAVGSANMIQQWAVTDSDEVNTVIMSNFQRNYRTILQRNKEDVRISPLVAGMIDTLNQKMLEGGTHE